jgi:predicted nucleotidyltransferase
MNRAQTLQLLAGHMPVLMKRFNVTDLALFGSAA